MQPKACMMVLFFLLAAHAASSLTVTTVPCGGRTNYGPSIPAGTQYVLSNCTAADGTLLTITLDPTSAAAALGLTVVAEHSRRVAIQISSTAAGTDITNLTVLIQNITNDAAEKTATSVVCSPSTCLSLLKIFVARRLLSATITVVGVVHVRNTATVSINDVRSVAGLSLSVTNATVVSTSVLVLLEDITATVSASTIVVHRHHHSITSTSVLTSSVMSVFVNNVPQVDGLRILIFNATASGSTNLGAIFVVLQLIDLCSSVYGECAVHLQHFDRYRGDPHRQRHRRSAVHSRFRGSSNLLGLYPCHHQCVSRWGLPDQLVNTRAAQQHHCALVHAAGRPQLHLCVNVRLCPLLN